MFVKINNEKIKNLFLSKEFVKNSVYSTIPIQKMIKECDTSGQLYHQIRFYYQRNTTSDFLDFSMMMGLHLGVFNLYCYQEINNSVKRKLTTPLNSQITTKKLFQNHKEAIAKYLNNTYGINEEETFLILENLQKIQENNPYYHDPIVEDIGKMIMGYHLHFYRKEIADNKKVVDHFFESGRAIAYFEECNKQRIYHKKMS